MSDDVEVTLVASLPSLAGTIRSEHDRVLEATHQALSHAIAAGDALNQARMLVPDGEWTRWTAANLPGIWPQTIATYCRLARYREHLATPDGPRTVRGAIDYLRGLPSAPLNRSGRRPSFDVDEAKRLRDAGLSYAAIGELLGVSRNAVQCQFDPQLKKKMQAATSKVLKRQRAARRALEQIERDAAVKAAGGSAASAYSLLRRCQKDLSAASEASQGEQAEMLHKAYLATVRAEDLIVQALRASRQAA